MITTEKIVGRLLILNHINAEEAVILLGGHGETDDDDDLEGFDEGYYADTVLDEEEECSCCSGEYCGACAGNEVKEEDVCSIPGCDCRTVQIPQIIEEWLSEINAKGKSFGYSNPSSTLNGPYFVWGNHTATNGK